MVQFPSGMPNEISLVSLAKGLGGLTAACGAPDPLHSQELFRAAFEKEREAAELIEDRTDLEPTRSVLFRSAASLAMDCRDFAEAERLLEKGLAGRPPEDLAEEMRNLRRSLPAKEPMGGEEQFQDRAPPPSLSKIADSPSLRDLCESSVMSCRAVRSHSVRQWPHKCENRGCRPQHGAPSRPDAEHSLRSPRHPARNLHRSRRELGDCRLFGRRNRGGAHLVHCGSHHSQCDMRHSASGAHHYQTGAHHNRRHGHHSQSGAHHYDVELQRSDFELHHSHAGGSDARREWSVSWPGGRDAGAGGSVSRREWSVAGRIRRDAGRGGSDVDCDGDGSGRIGSVSPRDGEGSESGWSERGTFASIAPGDRSAPGEKADGAETARRVIRGRAYRARQACGRPWESGLSRDPAHRRALRRFRGA